MHSHTAIAASVTRAPHRAVVAATIAMISTTTTTTGTGTTGGAGCGSETE